MKDSCSLRNAHPEDVSMTEAVRNGHHAVFLYYTASRCCYYCYYSDCYRCTDRHRAPEF